MKIATYNAHSGRSETGHLDLAAQAAEIADLTADIVCLQEVDRRTERSNNVDQLVEVCRHAEYPHVAWGAAMAYQGGEYGNALISRWPLSDIVVVAFDPVASDPVTHVDGKRRTWQDKAEPRSAVLATIHPGGLPPIRVFSAHLSIFAPERARAASQLLAALRGQERAAGGIDLNSSDPAAPERIRLLSGLEDLTVGSAAHQQPTFPTYAPAYALDMLLGRGVSPGKATITVTEATDHRAISVDIL